MLFGNGTLAGTLTQTSQGSEEEADLEVSVISQSLHRSQKDIIMRYKKVDLSQESHVGRIMLVPARGKLVSSKEISQF